MTFRKSLLACAISAAVAAVSVNAFACSTVIVGKSVSATGPSSSDTTKTTAVAFSILSTMYRLPSTKPAK